MGHDAGFCPQWPCKAALATSALAPQCRPAPPVGVLPNEPPYPFHAAGNVGAGVFRLVTCRVRSPAAPAAAGARRGADAAAELSDPATDRALGPCRLSQ